MTKNQIVDQVYLAVTGGKPTQDSDVQRADIYSLLDAGIESAVYQVQANDRVYALREARVSGVLPKQTGRVPVTLELEPAYSETRGLYYITLPTTPIIPTQAPSVEVQAKNGASGYVYTESQADAEGINDKLGFTSYWLESQDGEARVYLKGVGYPVCLHIAKAQLPVSEIPDTHDLGLGTGVEMEVVKILTEFFMIQKNGPRDLRMNQTDINGAEA